MNDLSTKFVGVVKQKTRPKLYKTAWGNTRRFFVQFADGQKSMFAAIWENLFEIGDTIEILGLKTDGEWMSIPEGAVVTLQENGKPELDEVTLDTGYITRLKEDGDKKFYLCYSFCIAKPEGLKVRIFNFPASIVWEENGVASPPSYSTVTVRGKLVDDTFFVQEIVGELPIQRFETIVIRVQDLKYHRFGADFVFNFGAESFVGSVMTPFFSSPILNVICHNWEGSVEISGVWLKRGRVTKENGDWKETVFWKLEKGKHKWESSAVQGVKDSIKMYEGIDGFRDLLDAVQSTGLINYDEVSIFFKKQGFDITPAQVRMFMWHNDLDETYINYLLRFADEVYQTASDEFFFYFKPNEHRTKAIVICEVPKERYSTIVIQEKSHLGITWKEQVNELLYRTREAVVKNQNEWSQIGIIRTISHDAEWETKLLVALS